VATQPIPLAAWLDVLPVLLCLAGAALLAVLHRQRALRAIVCGVVLVAVLASDIALLSHVLTIGPLAVTMGDWLPPFGISFVADAVGTGFALVSALVAFAVLLSLRAAEAATGPGVYPLLLLLLAGASGAVLTGDIFNLYVWFEVMLIAALGLVSLTGDPLHLEAALKYGVLNLIATTLLLAAIGLLYGLLGTLNMADIVVRAPKADTAALTGVAALLVLGLSIKAAAFPVNAWLPATYHAPPPAIGALLGGIPTKIAVYALIRVLVMLLPSVRELLAPVLYVLVIVTALVGPLMALAETRLRRAIGYLLVGSIGIALFCVPQSQTLVLSGSLSYALSSMLIIAALYLVSGLIEQATGAFAVREMHGLYAANAPLSLLFGATILALVGVPPFLGFWPKLLLLQGLLATGDWLMLFALLANSLLTLIVGARLWSQIFWRPVGNAPARVSGYGGAVLLTGAILLLSAAPGVLLQTALAGNRTLLAPAPYLAVVGVAP
jgi:multicomponent Na+:H+ antiporter subunit D